VRDFRRKWPTECVERNLLTIDHAIVDRRSGLIDRHEVEALRLDHVHARRQTSESRCQRALRRPPELVGIAVDDPVGPVLGEGHACHPSHPGMLVVAFAALVDVVHEPAVDVVFQDFGCRVLRAVVGHDEVVDALQQVVVEVRGNDVLLVANEKRHHDHQRAP
jgi:hypothetical protein